MLNSIIKLIMFIKLYLLTLPIFFAVDMLWLGVIAKNFYSRQIGSLMKTDINWLAAIIFYLLFIVGLVIFVISPALQEKSLSKVLISGALFGLITYATYDLTNLATLKNWPFIVTVVDLIWGTILATLVSLLSFLIAKKIGI